MKSAFTLMELGVVLVIIGQLAGGIIVGRDLIDAAEVKAQISQINRFQIATHTFENNAAAQNCALSFQFQ